MKSLLKLVNQMNIKYIAKFVVVCNILIHYEVQWRLRNFGKSHFGHNYGKYILNTCTYVKFENIKKLTANR